MLLTTKPLKMYAIDILITEVTSTYIKINTSKPRHLKMIDQLTEELPLLQSDHKKDLRNRNSQRLLQTLCLKIQKLKGKIVCLQKEIFFF